MEEESLAAYTAASEAITMMLRHQMEKTQVQMELCQLCRLVNEKMPLDAAEINHVRDLIARHC